MKKTSTHLQGWRGFPSRVRGHIAHSEAQVVCYVLTFGFRGADEAEGVVKKVHKIADGLATGRSRDLDGGMQAPSKGNTHE